MFKLATILLSSMIVVSICCNSITTASLCSYQYCNFKNHQSLWLCVPPDMRFCVEIRRDLLEIEFWAEGLARDCQQNVLLNVSQKQPDLICQSLCAIKTFFVILLRQGLAGLILILVFWIWRSVDMICRHVLFGHTILIQYPNTRCSQYNVPALGKQHDKPV